VKSTLEPVSVPVVSPKRSRKSPDRIRVVIADDHRLFAQALEAVLGGEERFEVVGFARNGREAIALVQELEPDVTLMDLSMPVLDGVEATREIRQSSPGARILMLTGSNAPNDVDRARAAGASGYVTKDRIAGELIQAILDVVEP
jgi:DNA-binding NarL/FixJ family response regulator